MGVGITYIPRKRSFGKALCLRTVEDAGPYKLNKEISWHKCVSAFVSEDTAMFAQILQSSLRHLIHRYRGPPSPTGEGLVSTNALSHLWARIQLCSHKYYNPRFASDEEFFMQGLTDRTADSNDEKQHAYNRKDDKRII